MSLLPDITVFQKRLSALPIATYQAGESVLVAGATTGQLLILKKGAVSIVKETIEIAKVTEVGAVCTLICKTHPLASDERPVQLQ